VCNRKVGSATACKLRKLISKRCPCVFNGFCKHLSNFRQNNDRFWRIIKIIIILYKTLNDMNDIDKSIIESIFKRNIISIIANYMNNSTNNFRSYSRIFNGQKITQYRDWFALLMLVKVSINILDSDFSFKVLGDRSVLTSALFIYKPFCKSTYVRLFFFF